MENHQQWETKKYLDDSVVSPVANVLQNTYLLRTRAPINAKKNKTNDHYDQLGEDIYDSSNSEELYNSEIYDIIKRHKARPGRNI